MGSRGESRGPRGGGGGSGGGSPWGGLSKGVNRLETGAQVKPSGRVRLQGVPPAPPLEGPWSTFRDGGRESRVEG